MMFNENKYESVKAVVVEFITTLDNKEDFDTVNRAVRLQFKDAGIKSYLTRYKLWKRLFNDLGFDHPGMKHWQDYRECEDTVDDQRLCVLCGKPYKTSKQRELCRECLNRIERIAKRLNRDNLDLGRLFHMKYRLGISNVLLALESNPKYYNKDNVDRLTSRELVLYYRGQNMMNMRRTKK